MAIIRQCVVAALIFVSLAFSQVALAGDIDDDTKEHNGNNATSEFFSKINGNNEGNIFSEKFTFSFAGLHDFDAEVSATHPNGRVGMAISSFDLYNEGEQLIATGTLDGSDKKGKWNMSLDKLAGGAYFLQVGGLMISRASDTMRGEYNLSPIPEADTYAMLLAGLGLIGFLSHRRRVSEKFS